MTWITFTRAFDWRPPESRPHTVIAFEAGSTLFVRRTCATEARLAGAARLATEAEIDGVRARRDEWPR